MARSRRKRCFKCGRVRTLSMFYEHPMMADGHLGKCKDCAKRDVRANYRAKRERYQKYDRARNRLPHRIAARRADTQRAREQRPGKVRAWSKVTAAIASGKLIRQPCEVCGDKRTDAHHDDYRRPLAVRWLCRSHHLQEHHA